MSSIIFMFYADFLLVFDGLKMCTFLDIPLRASAGIPTGFCV